MKYFFIAALVALAGSFAWNGFETPKLNDEEYLRGYKVLNATKQSDEEILKERERDELESMKWKHTNKLLDDELKIQGREELAAQKAIMQMQFFDAYYEHKVSAKDFVDYTYRRQR